MAKPVGRSLPVSPFRRVVADLMHHSRAVPSVTADRRMDLGPLIAARQALAVRPGWCVLFSKAFALLGRDYPELRRSYLKFPRPRLYEHPHSVASLNVEPALRGESIVLYCLIRAPENRSLAEMDGAGPLPQGRAGREPRRPALADITRIPWPLRHWFWWASLNMFGRAAAITSARSASRRSPPRARASCG